MASGRDPGSLFYGRKRMDLMNLTFAYVVQALAVIIVIYEVFKKIMEIKSRSDEDHDRRQKWDHAAAVLEEKEKKWDEGMKDAELDRKRIIDRYDGRLDEQDAKIQQLLAMLCMTLRAQDAILEALVEDGIGNGEIKAMHKELKDFILDQVN